MPDVRYMLAMHSLTVIRFFELWSSCRRVFTNHIGFVAVDAANPAHDALKMCTIGESEGKFLGKWNNLWKIMYWNIIMYVAYGLTVIYSVTSSSVSKRKSILRVTAPHQQYLDLILWTKLGSLQCLLYI